MIDEALLRPGRLEVHMEIGLPDEKGRLQIIRIHTNKMRTNNFMGEDVSLEDLAEKTKNFSGAEIEGLVKSATSFAFNKQIDASNPTKPLEASKVSYYNSYFLFVLFIHLFIHLFISNTFFLLDQNYYERFRSRLRRSEASVRCGIGSVCQLCAQWYHTIQRNLQPCHDYRQDAY